MNNKKPPEYLKYTTLGVQLVVTVLIGVFVGQWIDKRIENENSLFTIILSTFMIFIALFQLIRTFLK